MTPKEGLPTPTEKDDEAWGKIVDHLISEFFEEEEGKAIFLTRCAESAQEALAEGEKRRAALEEIAQAARNHPEHRDGGLCELCGRLATLDALTPTEEKKNSGANDSVEAPRTDEKLSIHGL